MALEKFNNGEQHSSVRTKINAAIDKVNQLDTVSEVHNPVLTFDKNKYAPAITQSAAITYSLAASGHKDGVVIRHKITSNGVNTITFPAGFNVFNKSEDNIYPAGQHIFYFNYIGGDIDVIIPTYVTESTPQIDSEAPSVPTGLSSPSKTETSVNLSWTASTDNVGVDGYNVYKNGVFEKEVGTNSATITGLTQGTSYNFTVSAIDATGNESAQTSPISVTTTVSADTTAPSVPTSLTSPSKTDITVDLSWAASTDAVGVTGYKIYKDGVFDNQVVGTTGQVIGLIAETAYSFTVSAIDAANNESAQSTALSVTTTAPQSNTQDADTILSLRAHDDYTGNLITVNNAEGTNPVAIGVVDGELDTQAIINNFPTGTVRVTEWYNQKNPSIKYVSNTIAEAPEICFDGVIKTVGGKPAIYFDGTDILEGPSLMNSLNASVFMVFQQAIGGYFGIVSDEDSTTPDNRFSITTSSLTSGGTSKLILMNISEGIDQRITSINNGLLNTPYSRTVTINAGVTKARINGVEQGTFTRAAVVPNAAAVIGAQTVSGSLFLKGFISEIIAFSTAKEAAAPSIEANQMSFYSI